MMQTVETQSAITSPCDSQTLRDQALRQLSRNLVQEQNQDAVLPADWIEQYFWVPRPRSPKTGEILPAGSIQLTDHQKHLINEALSRNPDGTFKYALVVYSAPKKSGKSAVAAAVATYVAHHS